LSWIKEQKEKFEVASSLLITIIIDLSIVIIVSFLLKLSKYILEEFVYEKKFEQIEEVPLIMIYNISKIFIILSVVIYAIQDIIMHIIHAYKKVKNTNE